METSSISTAFGSYDTEAQEAKQVKRKDRRESAHRKNRPCIPPRKITPGGTRAESAE